MLKKSLLCLPLLHRVQVPDTDLHVFLLLVEEYSTLPTGAQAIGRLGIVWIFARSSEYAMNEGIYRQLESKPRFPQEIPTVFIDQVGEESGMKPRVREPQARGPIWPAACLGKSSFVLMQPCSLIYAFSPHGCFCLTMPELGSWNREDLALCRTMCVHPELK